MNTLLQLSGAAWLQAALVALIMLGLGLEGMGGEEEVLQPEHENSPGNLFNKSQ